MSKKTKIILSLIISLLLLTAAVGASSIILEKYKNKDLDNINLDKYKNKDIKDISNELKHLSKKQLIKEINYISSTLESHELLIPFAAELFERRNEFKDKEIVKIITDDTNSLSLKLIMIDLYTMINENNPNKNDLKNLLKEKNISTDIKVHIVVSSEFGENEVELLKDLFEEDEELIAFHSLKKLRQANIQEAYDISKRILSNYKHESTHKVSAALKTTAHYFRNNRSSKNDNDKNSFISICIEILNTNKELKNSSIFALSDLMDKKAINEIINNKNIDNELKVFSIDQNYFTLNQILLNNPTEEDIEIVIAAMEILPIEDLVEPLEDVKKHVKNKDLKIRCDNVLDNMKLNGHKANLKWLDD